MSAVRSAGFRGKIAPIRKPKVEKPKLVSISTQTDITAAEIKENIINSRPDPAPTYLPIKVEAETFAECEVLVEEVVPVEENFIEEIIVQEEEAYYEPTPEENVETALGTTIAHEVIYEDHEITTANEETSETESQSEPQTSSTIETPRKRVFRTRESVLETEEMRSNRLERVSSAKRVKMANETPEERRIRLEKKKEVNRRYFTRESQEQKQIRLMRKANREKRNRLDTQLQFFHPDMLAEHGIEIVTHEDTVEIRVPWEVPQNETDEEQRLRYEMQEQVINQMITLETPAMEEYRKQAARSVRRPTKNRRETDEMRSERLLRQKELSRLRRQKETPQERSRRLDQQRIRTQRNRDAKNFRQMNEELKRSKLEQVEEIVIVEMAE